MPRASFVVWLQHRSHRKGKGSGDCESCQPLQRDDASGDVVDCGYDDGDGGDFGNEAPRVVERMSESWRLDSPSQQHIRRESNLYWWLRWSS